MKNLLVEYHVPTTSNGIDHQSAANSVLRKLQEKLTNLSRELRENFNISSNRCKIAAFFTSFAKMRQIVSSNAMTLQISGKIDSNQSSQF